MDVNLEIKATAQNVRTDIAATFCFSDRLFENLGTERELASNVNVCQPGIHGVTGDDHPL